MTNPILYFHKKHRAFFYLCEIHDDYCAVSSLTEYHGFLNMDVKSTYRVSPEFLDDAEVVKHIDLYADPITHECIASWKARKE